MIKWPFMSSHVFDKFPSKNLNPLQSEFRLPPDWDKIFLRTITICYFAKSPSRRRCFITFVNDLNYL